MVWAAGPAFTIASPSIPKRVDGFSKLALGRSLQVVDRPKRNAGSSMHEWKPGSSCCTRKREYPNVDDVKELES